MVTPGRVPRGFRSRRHATRVVVSLVLAVGALLATAVPLLACDIGITPSSATGQVGDTLVFTISVQQTHRVCSVPIEDTQIYLTGMELVSQTPWEQVSSTSNQKEITVRLTVAGEGLLEIVRVCSKGGDECAARVNIAPAAAPQVPPAEGQQDVEALPPALSGSDGQAAVGESVAPEEASSAPVPVPVAPLPADSHSFGEALVDTLQEPFVIALVVLMALGTVAVARGYRRWRPFILLCALGFFGFYVGGCPCPIGALQNAFIYFRDVAGHMLVYVQLGIVVIMMLLVGRAFCGWACPMDATQFFLFRKETGKKNRWLEIPREQHNILRWAKYGVLVALIGLVILTGQLVFEDIDPFRALFNLDFRWGVPLVFLILLLVSSVVVGFPFCKYVCPLGAFLGLLQPLSLFKLRFSGACTNCNQCSSVSCDYGAIEPGSTHPTINQMECVRCGECVSRCPRGAISITGPSLRRP